MMPSLRERKRYLVFELISRKNCSFKEASELVLGSCHYLIGSLGMSRAGVLMLQNCYKDNVGVVKVHPSFVDDVKSALALIRHDDVVARSRGLSGILNKAQKRFAG